MELVFELFFCDATIPYDFNEDKAVCKFLVFFFVNLILKISTETLTRLILET